MPLRETDPIDLPEQLGLHPDIIVVQEQISLTETPPPEAAITEVAAHQGVSAQTEELIEHLHPEIPVIPDHHLRQEIPVIEVREEAEYHEVLATGVREVVPGVQEVIEVRVAVPEVLAVPVVQVAHPDLLVQAGLQVAEVVEDEIKSSN